jgi:uncharacterized protein
MSETNETMCAIPGAVSWNELITPSTKAAGDFYGKLFGWKTELFSPKGAPAGAPPYTLFKIEGRERGVGGMMQPMQPGVPAHWLAYVVVENADKSLAKAVELGAKVFAPVMSIPEVGRVAVIQDPQGAVIGLHEVPKT